MTGRWGLQPRPEGSLGEQFLQAEATHLQMAAGLALAHGVAPGMRGLERGMDLSLGGTNFSNPAQRGFQWGKRGRNILSFLLQPALALSPQALPVESKEKNKHFLSAMTGTGRDSSPPSPPVVESVDPGVSAAEAKIEFPPALIEALRKAKRVTVLTGAGLSAESGIPTFRDGAAALWTNVSMDEVATAKAFAKNPDKVWRWHAEKRELLLQAKPNPAHFALAEMEREIPDFTLITQNIDGLHQAAGSKNVIEIHGNLTRLRCPNENKIVEPENKPVEGPPICPDCSSPLRHDVVWFGEQLPQEALNDAIQAAHHSEVFLSIGTSSIVNPAAALARRAVATKQTVVEINPNETSLSRRASFVLRGPAGKILPSLIEAVWRTAPPDSEASRKEVAARFRPLFPDDYREKILDAALNTEGKQDLFQERLLEAYSQDSARGTYKQLMTVLSIQDLFYGDATASSLGSFDAALLQTLIRRAASDPDSSKRSEAFQSIFRVMEDGMNRNALTALFNRFDYGLD